MSRKVKRGEMYCADLGPAIGGEHGGNKPVLVIQNDCQHGHTVVVAAITRKLHHRDRNHTHIQLPEGRGLLYPSIALLDHIRTIEKHRLTHFIGRLDTPDMTGIDHAIAVSLGLVIGGRHT